jgi:hypothetical protein
MSKTLISGLCSFLLSAILAARADAQFDADSINFLLRDLQIGWLRRFDEAK